MPSSALPITARLAQRATPARGHTRIYLPNVLSSMATKKQLPKVDKEALEIPEWPDELTPLQIRFLNSLALGGSVSRACRACKIARANPYRWEKSSPAFREAMAEALEVGVQRLEDWALARAMDDLNPSDKLTEFLLKSLRPTVYRERVDHHLHGTVEHRKRVVLEDLDEDRVIRVDATVNAGVDGSVTQTPLLEKRREEEREEIDQYMGVEIVAGPTSSEESDA